MRGKFLIAVIIIFSLVLIGCSNSKNISTDYLMNELEVDVVTGAAGAGTSAATELTDNFESGVTKTGIDGYITGLFGVSDTIKSAASWFYSR